MRSLFCFFVCEQNRTRDRRRTEDQKEAISGFATTTTTTRRLLFWSEPLREYDIGTRPEFIWAALSEPDTEYYKAGKDQGAIDNQGETTGAGEQDAYDC